jgi:uncharacterized membrane protein
VRGLARPGVTRRDTALLMGGAALALSFTPSLVARRRGDQIRISALAAVLGAAAGTAGEVAVVRLAGRLEGGEPAARTLLAAGALVSSGLRLPAHRSSGIALAGSGAIVAGAAAVLGAVAPVRSRSRLRDPWVAAAAAVLATGAALGARAAQKRPPRARLTEWPDGYPEGTSGGDGSLLPREKLDFEGRRFLGTTLRAERIEALRGAPARAPIRVFAGVGSAPTVEERCALAVAELERLGAFDRPRVVVWSATLRGYVNPVPMQAEELFGRGDVAGVCVQFWDRPTPLMPLKVRIAAHTHAELLRRLAERVGPDGPEIVVYGESLGAWASQNVFRREGVRALDGLRVGRALWAGTPFFSRLPRLMARGKVPSDDRVGLLNTRELLAADPADAARLRFLFLQRRADPVVLFSGLELIWRRPDWLPDAPFRPDGVPRAQRWIPGITFLQVAVDLMRATRWTSDVPRAAAHDYRVELPLAVNTAFGHHLPRAEAVRLADELIAMEVERAGRLKALRRGQPRERAR